MLFKGEEQRLATPAFCCDSSYITGVVSLNDCRSLDQIGGQLGDLSMPYESATDSSGACCSPLALAWYRTGFL